ncbi:WD repeat-containing protein 75 [Haplosporangium sp. Z 767]|nr:WD repeat-containing protein 75 [Haplosporangium sp. Z 767]
MRLSDYPMVYTSDSNYIFSCNGKSIRILSIETGQVVRILSSSVEDGGHSEKVTTVILNPKNPLQLYSASLDGTIKLWDFNDAVLLKTYEVGVPITHMVVHESLSNHVYLITTKKSTKKYDQYQARKSGGLRVKENSVLLRFSLASSQRKLVRLLKTRVCCGLAISSDGEYLVVAGRYKLHVIHIAAGNGIEEGGVTEKDEARFRCYLTPEKITCLAFHPTEGCIATGSETGRITLWYCFGKNVDRPVTTTMHWHAHQVTAIAFSADGTYLLSGGEEAVLVIWQLQTGHKQFLPRLGSEIKHITISPDQGLYAISHQDNSINVIRSVDLKIKTVIQGLKFAHVNHIANPLSTGLIIEPRNGHVVLNGTPGTIQFYDVVKEQHIMELEITPRNKVSRTDDKEIIQPQVMHCAFTSDKAARWMVTVDGRDDKETTPELYLKFWEYDDDAHTYVLNTRVDAPHSSAITSCMFNPRQGNQAPMAVTTSLDGTFKIWELTHQGEARRGIEAERAWGCRSTGFYRDMIPHCAGFSSDGSLLAIAYGQIITLWNPYLNTLQGVLVQPPENRPVKHLTFLKNSPFLIAATKDHLYCWNLLTCSVWWSYQIKVDKLIASQTNSNFMVTCPDPTGTQGAQHRIFVFKPTSPKPVSTEVTGKKIRAATFMPDTTYGVKDGAEDVESILIMNHGYDLEILGRTIGDLQAEALAEAEKARALAAEAEKQKSMLTDIFGKSGKISSAEKKKERQQEGASRGMVSKKNMVRNPLFDAPSHVMAPVSSLYEAFMGQMLTQNKTAKEEAKAKKKKQQQEQAQEEQANDESSAIHDVDMADEEGNKDDVAVDTELPSSLAQFFSSRLTL